MSKSALVIVLLALVVGGAVGFLAGQGVTPPPPAATSPERDSPPEPWRPRADAGGSTVSSPDESAFHEVISGHGVITGRVAKESGEGIPGATVRATLATLPPPDEDGSPPDANRRISALIASERLAAASRREASTGEDGSFRIEGLAERPHRVEAWKRGLTFESDRADRVRPGQSVDFVARPRLLLTVRVRLSDGEEPAEAELTVVPRGRGAGRMPYFPGMASSKSRPWRPDRRAIALVPGSYEVSASSGLYGEMRSEPVTVAIRENETPEDVVLDLEAKPGVRGTVRYEDGIADAQGSVWVSLVKAGAGAEPTEEEFRMGRRVTASAGQGLAYVIPDVEPGDYWLGAMIGWQPRATSPVTVTEGFVEQDLVVPAPAAGETFVARVLGPDGESIAGATFRLDYRVEGKGNQNRGVFSAQLPDGTYRLRPNRTGFEPDPAGRAFLAVYAPDLGVEEVEFDLDAAAPLTVVFKRAGTLNVHLEGMRPEQAETLMVYLARVAIMGQTMEAGGVTPAGSRPSKDPVRKFEGLQPGRYRLYLYIQSGFSHLAVEEREITLGSGEAHESIVVPALHDLTVILSDETIRYLQIYSEGQAYPGHAQRTSSGRVVLKGLPAGRYGLVAQTKSGQIGMTVRVPAQSTVEFAGNPLNALRVRIKEESGLLAGAGFRAGDLVVGVNGETFEDEKERQAKILLASQKSPARFIVLRGSQRLEIPFDAAAIGARRQQDLGGWLEPTAR